MELDDIRLVVEWTDVDMACMYCSSPTEMAYYDEVAMIFATSKRKEEFWLG